MKRSRMRKGRLLALALSATAVACAFAGALLVALPGQSTSLRDANWQFADASEGGSESLDAAEAQNGVGDDTYIEDEGGNPLYVANEVLISFDGNLTSEDVTQELAEAGVQVQEISLVSKSLDDNKVLVSVEYAGDTDPADMCAQLEECEFVESSYLPDDDTAILDAVEGSNANRNILYQWGGYDSFNIDTIPKKSSVPSAIASGVKSVAANGEAYDTYALITTSDILYMWGNNEYGQIGKGNKSEFYSAKVPVMNNVSYVSLASDHSACITTDGDLYVWGRNNHGQIGDGTTIDRTSPVKILENVVSVSLSCFNSAAVTSDGSLYVWGCNDMGYLGDGTYQDRTKPYKVMDNVVSACSAGTHFAAVTSDGVLYTWGYNKNGQLGNGTTVTSLVPKPVMQGVSSVYGSAGRTAVIKNNGDLYICGANNNGSLGDGTTTSSAILKKVLSGVSYVSLNVSDTAAIAKNGDLYMWGKNTFGRLGDGTTNDSYVPKLIMSGVTSAALSFLGSAAVGGWKTANYSVSSALEYTGESLCGFSSLQGCVVTSGVSTATDAGKYTVTIVPDTANGYAWADGTATSKTISWSINKKSIEPPVAQSYNYDGTEHIGIPSGEGYTLSGTYSATEAGSYTAYATLDSNHIWSDGTTKQKTFKWEIERISVEAPLAESYVYDGTEHIGIPSGEGYTLSGTYSATEAGSYTAYATLDSNHIWSNGASGAMTLKWEIKCKLIEVPIVTSYVYDGTSHSGVSSSDGYTLSGTVSAKNAGEYTVKATLKPSYIWSNGTAEDFQLTWEISRKPVEKPCATNFEYTGSTLVGVKSSQGYRIEGVVSAVNPGNYKATAILDDNYKWREGGIEDVTLEWTISKKIISVPKDNVVYDYTGDDIEIPISGDLYIWGDNSYGY